MNDPYSVLGISPTATDEEIKKVYRDLARKYHPDTYQNNPLADLAEEKMKEINDAYETITKIRKGGGTGATGSQGNPYQNNGSQNPIYQQIRAMIQVNNLAGAESLLQANQTLDAEWSFLAGMIAYRKGWLDEAQRHFARANQLDPLNPEYRQAFQSTQRGGFQGSTPSTGCCCCPCSDCCTTLLCVDCLCNSGCCC